MTQQEVATLIAYVGITWPTARDRSTSDAATTVRVWTDYLADATIDEAQAAVRVFGLRGDPFPPGPAQVAAQVIELRARARGESAPTADAAYAYVIERVRVRGWYGGAGDAWPHEAIARTVTAIGWDELCHGDVMIVRAHFLKLYDIAVRAAANVQLAGLVELSKGGPIRTLDSVTGPAELTRGTLPDP